MGLEEVALLVPFFMEIGVQVIDLISEENPIRQGDVLSYVTDACGPYGAKSAVVLTADCDLAQSKHYGQLLLCPIVPISVLLNGPWAQRRLRRVGLAARLKVRGELLRLLGETEYGLSDSTISAITVSAETMENGISGISGILPKDRARLIALARVCAACAEADESLAMQSLLDAYMYRDALSVDKAKAKLLSEFKDEMKGDNTDVVVLPDELRGQSLACVILLRCPYATSASEVTTFQSLEADLIRVGRLCAPIKYLVAQKFGLLFSRLGMPGQIEGDRNSAVDFEELAL